MNLASSGRFFERNLKDLFLMPPEPPQMYLDSFTHAGALVTALNQARVRRMAILKAKIEASKALGLDPSTETIPPELLEHWIELFIQGLMPYIEAQQRAAR